MFDLRIKHIEPLRLLYSSLLYPYLMIIFSSLFNDFLLLFLFIDLLLLFANFSSPPLYSLIFSFSWLISLLLLLILGFSPPPY